MHHFFAVIVVVVVVVVVIVVVCDGFIFNYPLPGIRACCCWERLCPPSPLDNNGPCHNVVHSPVVLEEEESDEDGKEEGDGEVLI